MEKDQSLNLTAPMLFIGTASFTSIVFGILPYLTEGLFQNQAVMQYALLGCGSVCLLATLVLLLKYNKIHQKSIQIPVEEKEKEAEVKAALPPPHKTDNTDNDQAVLLLSLLQEKGRFVDFVMGDITPYNDEQIGAAARVVHQGCNELIKDCFQPEAISKEDENKEITLNAGFNTREYKITGDVGGNPPYNGKLVHKGWKANHVKLPQLSLPPSQSDTPVIQPAEIEL